MPHKLSSIKNNTAGDLWCLKLDEIETHFYFQGHLKLRLGNFSPKITLARR